MDSEMKTDSIRQSMVAHLRSSLAKVPETATLNDWFLALALTARSRLMQKWIHSLRNYTEDVGIVAYLSAEYVVGPQLGKMLVDLGMYDDAAEAVKELGLSLSDLLHQEAEPGLGSGGRGRLAACFMDSLATLDVPAIGYGVRYEYGSFRQEIHEGWQVEMTDKWLSYGNPWEVQRPEIAYTIKLGGHTESYYDEHDCFRVRWIPKFALKGVAYDTPVSGYQSGIINLLRLWKAEAIDSFDYESFRTGDYFSALNEKIASESISKILYPDDEPYAGKQLRLAQQYFFVSCALQDMIRMHLLRWRPIHTFSDSFSVHMHDAPSAIAVAEMMRLLVDEHLVSWDKAWYITQNTFSHTNHAMLAEAIEKWPVQLFSGILPRHIEIIYEINRRFLDELWITHPNDAEKLSRLSVIDESDQKYIRLSHLALLGSHAVSAVSRKHAEVLQNRLFSDFHALYPERFFCVMNGVSPRYWVVAANPGLSSLISSIIGDGWIRDLQEIQQLESFAADPSLMKKWREVKRESKILLGSLIRDKTGIAVDPDTLFDVQVKRFHESSRHHLNLLHILTLYCRIKRNPGIDVTPRTCILAGKASPGYFMAQLIVKLIHSAAAVINDDPDVAGRLKIVFFPDLNAKYLHRICPAADLSEQISTAGCEAAGIGGIKLALNGAVTIGSRNGTNIDLASNVGADHVFLFGLSGEEVILMKSHGYHPAEFYRAHADLKEVIDLISSGMFSRQDVTLFKPLIDSLLNRDEYMVLADYQSYLDSHERINATFRDTKQWAKMSIRTVSRMGSFSSDRAIREYREKIWHTAPVQIQQGSIERDST